MTADQTFGTTSCPAQIVGPSAERDGVQEALSLMTEISQFGKTGHSFVSRHTQRAPLEHAGTGCEARGSRTCFEPRQFTRAPFVRKISKTLGLLTRPEA